MRIAEWIQFVFACLLSLAAWIRPLALQRRVKVTALAMAVVTAILSAHFIGRLLPPLYLSIVHDWLPAVLLFVPYWQVGQFYTGPNQNIQQRLAAFDRGLLEVVLPSHAHKRWGIGLGLYMEFAYLMCYPIVPLGIAVLYAAGVRHRADHYWTVVLVATYVCFAVTPFVQALPPRMLATDNTLGIPPTRVRALNRWILRCASIHVITFPSAHVAASVAASLVPFEVVPWMGLVFAWVAGSIAVAAVVGGYHYIADVLSAIMIAFLAFVFFFFIARQLC
jgi:membrane-associated phospholipid phosphatase